jgi:phage shock protein E
MTCEKIKELMKDPSNTIIDVRTLSEYQQSRIDGAQLISLHEIPNNVDLLRSKNVYLYCRSGARSEQATSYLRSFGINAINIGGLTSYMGCLKY